MAENKDSFPINPKDYLSFDANNLKEVVLRNLNAGGFPDTQFEGSNWSALTDAMSAFFGMYLYYLNSTSSEHTFSVAQLKENMTRMVGSFNYSVGGKQTAILPFRATNKRDEAGDFILADGVYTIPRYTSFIVNGVVYTFASDISFTIDGNEDYIKTLSDNNTLFQGTFEEYPEYTSIGEEFEKILLNVKDATGNPVAVDHFNIHAYVKNIDTGVWRQWKRVETLYLTDYSSESFEVRLNPKGLYEIRFGDGVSGKQLNAGDVVQLYYLRSDMTTGEIGSGILDGNSPNLYATPQFFNVVTNAGGAGAGIPYMTATELSNIAWSNILPSTKSYQGETVEDIRKHAPKFTRYKNFTGSYIQAFVDKNFKGIAYSTKVINNKDFINGHLAYGIKMNEATGSRILQNFNTFSTCAAFNNIYIYVSPNNPVIDINGDASFVLDSQKAYMLQNMGEIAIPTADFVFMDPVYMEVNFGIVELGSIEVLDAVAETRIVILGDTVNKRNPQAILTDFYNIVEEVFDYKNNALGGVIDYTALSFRLGSIEGVSNIFTVRENAAGKKVNSGISLVMMSRETPKEDFQAINFNVTLDYWKFPYFNLDNLRSKVSVQYADTGLV